MLTIVEDAVPNDSVAEKLVKAKAWSRVLQPIIPEERLPDAFALAFQKNTTSFSVNQYDLKNAWYEIADRESKAKIKRDEKRRKKFPWEFCSEKDFHLAGTKGQVKIKDLWTGEDQDVVVPCKLCREAEYEKWHGHQVALYGEINPLNRLVSEFNERKYFNRKDPLEVLNNAKDEVSREMVKVVGTSDYDAWRGAWKILVHALKYVRENDGVNSPGGFIG